ncbi:MAG: branched-chain amino acid ABC transporter permease, partial [Candidatus Aenigmatarchaeota archaeon]
ALTNIILLTWSADYRMVTPQYSGSGITIEGIAIPYIRIITFLIAIVLTVLLHLFLTKTKTGNAIRATGMDISASRLNGVNVSRIYSITFGIGAALAGSAGSLISITHSFSPTIGGSLTLKSFVICVLGGLGSAGGALAGGVLLGLVESFGSVYLGSGFKDAISFAMLVIVLIISPKGILGKEFYR